MSFCGNQPRSGQELVYCRRSRLCPLPEIPGHCWESTSTLRPGKSEKSLGWTHETCQCWAVSWWGSAARSSPGGSEAGQEVIDIREQHSAALQAPQLLGMTKCHACGYEYRNAGHRQHHQVQMKWPMYCHLHLILAGHKYYE